MRGAPAAGLQANEPEQWSAPLVRFYMLSTSTLSPRSSALSLLATPAPWFVDLGSGGTNERRVATQRFKR